MLHDADIRALMHAVVLKRDHACPGIRIIDEFGLAEWGAHRADVVVASHDLHGYELKAFNDTLDNLEGHIKAYSAVCDRVTIVAAAKHLHGVYKRCPEWFGVSVAHDGYIDQLRPAGENPAVDCRARVNLMWRAEAWQILKDFDLHKGKSGYTRKRLQNDICKNLAPDQILRATLDAIKVRRYTTGKREAGRR